MGQFDSKPIYDETFYQEMINVFTDGAVTKYKPEQRHLIEKLGTKYDSNKSYFYGGWAWAAVDPDNYLSIIVENSGYELLTTVSRMELSAVINFLTEFQEMLISEEGSNGIGSLFDVSEKTLITIHTDSEYVLKCYSNWNKWLKERSKTSILNYDLIETLIDLSKLFRDKWGSDVVCKHVKGHSDSAENGYVDKLAVSAKKNAQSKLNSM